jgi:hypothetical protein
MVVLVAILSLVMATLHLLLTKLMVVTAQILSKATAHILFQRLQVLRICRLLTLRLQALI